MSEQNIVFAIVFLSWDTSTFVQEQTSYVDGDKIWKGFPFNLQSETRKLNMIATNVVSTLGLGFVIYQNYWNLKFVCWL